MSLVRRVVPRFSLRTLLLFVLMVGAGGALWLRWEPWQVVLTLRPGGTAMRQAFFSPDGRFIVTHSSPSREAQRKETVIWDRTGRELYRTDWSWDMGASGYDGASFVQGSDILQLENNGVPTRYQLIDTRTFNMMLPEDGAYLISFAQNAKRYAAVFNDEKLKGYSVVAYDIGTEKQTAEWMFTQENDSNQTPVLTKLIMSPNGNSILVAQIAYDRLKDRSSPEIYLCDSLTKQRDKISTEEGFFIEDAFFSTDGSRFVVLGRNTFFVYETATQRRLLSGEFDSFHQLSASTTDFVQLNTNNRTRVLRLSGASPSIEQLDESIALEPMLMRGHWLVRLQDRTLIVRNMRNGKEYSTNGIEMKNELHSLVFYEGDDFLRFNTKDKTFLLFDIRNGTFSLHGSHVSPDRTRQLKVTDAATHVLRFPTDDVLAVIHTQHDAWASWAPDSQQLICKDGAVARVYQRVRSDEPGNLVWEPALWLAILFAGGFFHSVWVGLRARRG